MENTANQPNTAAEKPEEKAGTQNDTAENPSEVRTDSAFDEESEGSRASEKQENPDETSAGAGAGGAGDADDNAPDTDTGADVSPKCQTDLNELVCRDMKNDIKKYREIRDLASRVFTKDGCVFRSEYTMKRFCHSVIWYTKNAKSMKRAFFVLSAFTIALPTIATLLNSVPDELIKNIQLWDMVANLTAFLNLFKFQHKWVQFRSTSEELQTELTVYLAQAGDYSEKTLTKPYVAKDKPVPEFSGEKLDELRENMFLINIEKIMAKEKSQWENLHKPSK